MKILADSRLFLPVHSLSLSFCWQFAPTTEWHGRGSRVKSKGQPESMSLTVTCLLYVLRKWKEPDPSVSELLVLLACRPAEEEVLMGQRQDTCVHLLIPRPSPPPLSPFTSCQLVACYCRCYCCRTCLPLLV